MTTGQRTRRKRLWSAAAVAAVAAALVAVCAGGTYAWSDREDTRYYLSVGDSYAAGYRADGASGATAGDGFAYQVLGNLRRTGPWELKNYGCVGQTAHGMQFDNGCQAGALAAGGVDYPNSTQEAAAEQFMAEHRDRIGLVTVAMGANDITKCLDLPDDGAAQWCAEQASADIRQSLGAFLTATRSVLGDGVPIVGVSYINVFRAAGLAGAPDADRRAALSRVLFDNYLNPTLRDTYAQFGAHFVDTTELAGNDLPDSRRSLLVDHGTVSTSVARVCDLTYYCSDHDPHPNRSGHALIARAIEEAIS